MTPSEGQALFNDVLSLILTCYIISLGIGYCIKIFKEALKY